MTESAKMPKIAKSYIALVIASGTTLLLFAAGSWSNANIKQFAIYLGLAALASTLKIRIPRLESTVSPNFLFLLLGMAVCQFSEVVVISLTSAIVQSLWASSKRPRLVQVAFSAAALVVSSSLAYALSHRLLIGDSPEFSVSRVILAGSLYFPLNSALVSAVISLVEGQPLRGVFGRCYQSVFPYFVGGIAFAALVSGFYSVSTAWMGALLLVPVVVFSYFYSLSRSQRSLPAAVRASSVEQHNL
jgi:hypothetical protein